MEYRSFNFNRILPPKTLATRSMADTTVDEDEDNDEDEEYSRAIVGNAIVFNSDSEDMGGWVEQVSPNAFVRSIQAANSGDLNIYAFWEHQSQTAPIGSTRSGSLTISQDENGLSFNLAPDRLNIAQLSALTANDMKMSFGMYVNQDDWSMRSDGTVVRTVLDADLVEISPVCFPAYSATNAGVEQNSSVKRSYQAFIDKYKQPHKTNTRAQRLRLLELENNKL